MPSTPPRSSIVGTNADSTEVIAATTPLKLSSFASREAFAWFQLAEVQFRIQAVTRSTAKVDYVLVVIPEDTFPEISDWLCEQGDTPVAYDAHKSYLLQQYLPSPAARIANLFPLSQQMLGDQRASLALREMTSIARLQPAADGSPREVNLLRLPGPIRTAIPDVDSLPIRDLMTKAEALMDSHFKTSINASTPDEEDNRS